MFVIMMRRVDGTVRKMAERGAAGPGTLIVYARLDDAWVEAAQYYTGTREDGEPEWLYYPVRLTERVDDEIILID